MRWVVGGRDGTCSNLHLCDMFGSAGGCGALIDERVARDGVVHEGMKDGVLLSFTVSMLCEVLCVVLRVLV